MNRGQLNQRLREIATNTDVGDVAELNRAHYREKAYLEYIGTLETKVREGKPHSIITYTDECRVCGEKFNCFKTNCTCPDKTRIAYVGIAHPDGTMSVASAFKGGDTIEISKGMIMQVGNHGIDTMFNPPEDGDDMLIILNDGTEVVIEKKLFPDALWIRVIVPSFMHPVPAEDGEGE